MSVSNLKNEIKNKIDQILGMDLSKLYPNFPNSQIWNNLNNDELKDFVEHIKENLNVLSSSISILDQAPPQNIPGFDNHINNFINTYTQQLQNLDIKQITSHHHGALNQLSAINDNLRNLGLQPEIRLTQVLNKNIPDLKQAGSIAKELSGSAQEIKDSIKQAKSWLDVRRDLHGKTIEEQAEAFHDMASSHKAFKGWKIDNRNSGSQKSKLLKFLLGFNGSWAWMAFSVLFAGVTAIVTYLFIVKVSVGGSDIEIGEALLRIASLVVPAYLTLFCANQFLYHKRMYDNYMFKYSSMNTMNNLIATHKERGDKILDKGLDVLFSEPRTKDRSGKYDYQLVNELIKMLREQMN